MEVVRWDVNVCKSRSFKNLWGVIGALVNDSISIISLHGFLKRHQKSLRSGQAKPRYTPPKGLPYPSLYSHWTAPQILLFYKVSMSACSLFLILSFPSSTPSVSLALFLSFGRAPASVFMCWRNSCLVQGVRLARQAGCRLCRAQNTELIVSNAHSLSHTRMHAQSSSLAHKPPGHVHLHPF